jgi:hypothetical protein
MEKAESIVLDKKQKEILDNLKKYVREELKRNDQFICDFFIYRFLLSTSWDVEKAIEMLNNYFPFRDRMISLLQDYYNRKGMVNLKIIMTKGLSVHIKGIIMKEKTGKGMKL